MVALIVLVSIITAILLVNLVVLILGVYTYEIKPYIAERKYEKEQEAKKKLFDGSNIHKFKICCIDQLGCKVEFVLTGASPDDVNSQLRQMGCFPITADYIETVKQT